MGEVNYRPLIDDMVWSYSRIESFHNCPYKFFLKYIRWCKDAPRFYSSYGKFMHKLLEQYYNGELTQEEMQIKFLFDFQKEVQGERPKGNIVQNYIRQGSDYLKQFRPLPYQTVAVEKELHFNIGGFPFVGILDYIGRREDGKLVIVDNKSRALKPRSNRDPPTVKDNELDEMLKQLYIYAAAVQQEYDELPAMLCFNCFRTGTFIEEPFCEEAYHDALEWATQSILEIQDESEFNPFREFFGCYYLCGVSGECCYWNMR